MVITLSKSLILKALENPPAYALWSRSVKCEAHAASAEMGVRARRADPKRCPPGLSRGDFPAARGRYRRRDWQSIDWPTII
jgi:hypothetical protein